MRLLLSLFLGFLALAYALFRLLPDLPARFLVWFHLKFDRSGDRLYGRLKQRLLGGLRGTVVEIGPGVGANLPYYPPGIRWIGIEPNRFMHGPLREKARAHGIEGDLHLASAEHIDLADGSADAVVGTLVLCSVRDQAAVLAEIRRVLKPGGRYVFVEHVAAPVGTWTRRFQGWVRPLWSTFGHGCEPDRETWAALERAGFDRLDCERLRMKTLPLIAPHLAGVAVKASR